MPAAHRRDVARATWSAVVLALALPSAALAYDTSDLLGSWRVHGLASGPGQPYWERGRARFAADGSFTAFTLTNTAEADTVQGAFALGPTGILTTPGEPTMRGALDIGRTVMMWTDTWDSGAPGTTQLMLGLKQLGANSVSDLAGNWDLHSIASGPGAPWWMRGRLAIASDGSFTGNLTEQGGTPEPVSGSFALTPDGVLSLSVAGLAEGALDAGRTVFALTNTWTGFAAGTTELSLGVKLGASYVPADVAGTWELYSLATGPGAPWWSRGQITIAANGSYSGTQSRSDGSSGPMSGTMTLASDGTLTRAGSTTARGSLDAGRSVMLWTDTWTSGSPGTSEIFVGVRTGGSTTDAPTAMAALALEPLRPNPARGGAVVRFRLKGVGEARLTLLDPQGRAVRGFDLGRPGAGWHQHALTGGLRLAPGLYWLRLDEGDEFRTRRVVILD